MSVTTEAEVAAPEQAPEQTREHRALRVLGRRTPRRGWVPEPALASVLAELADDGWVVLSDLTWPGRWVAPLEHVVVGPAGVVVLTTDARPWRLTADSDLRLGLRSGTRECRAVVERATDVASLVRPEHRGAVHPVLCLTTQPLPAVAVEHGVTATGPGGLVAVLGQLPRVLDASAVREVSADLAHYLAAQTGVVDRGAALLGLVPAPRLAVGVAVPVAGLLVAPEPTPSSAAASGPTAAQLDGQDPASDAEPPAGPVVHATRREAIAAEKARARRGR